MPVLDETQAPASTGPRTEVESSLAVELEWAMATPLHPDWVDDHPTLGPLLRRRPDLTKAVAELWEPELTLSCAGFLELIVLAHHAGSLFTTDAGALLTTVGKACTDVPTQARHLPLRSETEEDRAAVLARLTRLRRSPARRRRYLDTVAGVWEALRDDWEEHGRPSVARAASASRRALETGARWQDLAATTGFSDHLATTVAALPGGSRVVVAPAYYTHKGLFVELPGLLLIGVRSESDGAMARARTQRLARQLKTLADPTRLAILDTLRRGPRSVTELATAFSLAQPTVSNHVKLLRDAGLVGDVRHGRRRQLVVQVEEVDRLVGGLQEVLEVSGTSVQA